MEATTGAAPVPVPPPRPVVMNTMSEPSRASQIFSVSSTAACRPTSGLAPAPRPLVSLPPIWIFTGARFERSACRSVLMAMNSTPCRPDAIMRLIALPPPPPTPTTLMRAPLVSSSAKVMRPGPSLVSLGIQIPSEHPVMNPQCRQMRLQWEAITADPHISQRGSPSRGRNTPGRTASRTR